MLSFLDARTLIYTTFVMIMTFSGIIAWQRKSFVQERAAVSWYAAGCMAFAVGGLLMGLRGQISNWLSMPIGNGGLALGVGLCWIGLRCFQDQRPPYLAVATCAALSLVSALPFMPPRVTMFGASMAMALMSLAAVQTVMRGRRRTSSRWLIALGFASFGLATGSRAVEAVFRQVVVPSDQMIAVTTESLKLLMALASTATTLWTAGFLLLVGERLRERLEYLASHDATTQTYNRRAFMEIAEREVRQAERKQEAISLVLADLDHFKQINDTFGHPVGDAVLQVFAEAAKTALRQSDWLARYGGEEFIMLLPAADRLQAATVAERLRAHYGQTRGPNMGDHPLSVSLGVADAAAVGYSLEHLLVAADRALYAAKKAGRDRVMVANSLTEHTLS